MVREDLPEAVSHGCSVYDGAACSLPQSIQQLCWHLKAEVFSLVNEQSV